MTGSKRRVKLAAMYQEKSKVIGVEDVTGDYKLLKLQCPKISASARPGQFVHILVPKLDGSVLRRPFSILSSEGGVLCVLFKVVGRGTRVMGYLAARDELSVIGPLGNGFPEPAEKKIPLLVAGGYGVAPLYFLASRMKKRGVLFVGGRSNKDLLCIDRFRALGWETLCTTDDGSEGRRGVVIDAVNQWAAGQPSDTEPEFFACGPDGMLRALSLLTIANGWTAWLSLDKHMGCGIGACLACVQKIRSSDGSECWKRVCRDGPIFEAGEIVWGDPGR